MKITKIERGTVEQQEYVDPNAPSVGRWYWVTDDEERALGCVTHIGSNYVRIEYPGEFRRTSRIHLDEFDAQCQPEPNAEQIIAEHVAANQAKVRQLMAQVQEITVRLGIGVGARQLEAVNETQALATRAGNQPIEEYKSALIKAKEETLPKLFEQIAHENKEMAVWMSAAVIPLRAQAEELKPVIKSITSRVFNVELYAGLVERVTQVKDGEPASMNTPVSLLQRRAYMDEECLAQYEAGGMEFGDIKEFDAWLARPDNLDRLMPHPRCVLAFQVRRKEKERNIEGLSDFISMLFGRDREADKSTFLYLRNGEKLFRLQTAIEFGEKLFPDLDKAALLTGQLYARDSGEEIITEGRYRQMVDEEEAKHAQNRARYLEAVGKYRQYLKAWRAGDRLSKKPERPSRFFYDVDYRYRESERYKPWNRDSVYFDDIAKAVKDKIDEHNRLVMVLQGILDRSPVMHPHPAWQIWTEEGFRAGIRLIYDDSRALTPGEKPDFEAYRARLNATLKTGSITVGQEEVWERREAEKENERPRRDRYSHYTRYRPYGNEGPGSIARVARFSPTKGCSYRWTRQRSGNLTSFDRRWLGKSYDDRLPCAITVPSNQVLNVDAYKPGDFKQFFADPRTREEYLKWAPLLLEAEEYHAGNRKVGNKEDIEIAEERAKENAEDNEAMERMRIKNEPTLSDVLQAIDDMPEETE